MSSLTMRSSVVLCAILVAACTSGADQGPHGLTAPDASAVFDAGSASNGAGAERVLYEAIYDLNGSRTAIECADGQWSELVELEGQIYERFLHVSTASGVERSVYQTMPVGLRGIGVESGEEYRVVERDHGTFGQGSMGLNGSYRQVIRLIGLKSGRRFELISSGHYNVGEDGDIRVDRNRVEVTCSF